jgi:hypothetical protein
MANYRPNGKIAGERIPARDGGIVPGMVRCQGDGTRTLRMSVRTTLLPPGPKKFGNPASL